MHWIGSRYLFIRFHRRGWHGEGVYLNVEWVMPGCSLMWPFQSDSDFEGGAGKLDGLAMLVGLIEFGYIGDSPQQFFNAHRGTFQADNLDLQI